MSGAAGAAITLKALVFEFPFPDLMVSIAISALIAAATVAGKAWGKTIALKRNKDIVLSIGTVANFFNGGRKKNEKEN